MRDCEKDAVPTWEPREVVAVSPPEREELVPHAKPDWVALAPPVAVIEPFNVREEVETEEAAEVEIVGRHGDVRNVSSLLSPVP